MSDAPAMSPFFFRDGVFSLPDVKVESFIDPHPELIRNWQQELGLPEDPEELRALAQSGPSVLSRRQIRFVVADESATMKPDSAPLRPQEWSFTTGGQRLVLEHVGPVVGVCTLIVPGVTADDPEYGEEGAVYIDGATGHYLVGMAQLYYSRLADAAWRGLQLDIFTHVCPIVATLTNGTQELVEISLTHRPICPGARILDWQDVDA